MLVDDEERLVVLVAGLVVDRELLVVDANCSEISFLVGAPRYLHIHTI